MKKQLALITLLSLCIACQKETTVNPQSSTMSTGGFTKHTLVTTGGGSGSTGGGTTGSGGTVTPSTSKSYTDLVLQPRQPGQNYDSYTCTWNGVYMMITGNPQWNMVTYPCLVNGVPTVYGGVGVNAALYLSAGNGGQVANIPQVTSVSDQTGQTVFTLQVIYIAVETNGYGNSSGFGASTIVNYTGKLIRVTTGSNWAIADIGYPTPAPGAGCTVPTNLPAI